MSAIGKKLHHYVPRFYLRAWAEKEAIYCLQGSKIFRANIEKVGAENYFYRLRELSPKDVELIRELVIKDSPEGLKSSHERLIQAFSTPYLMKQELQASGRATPKEMAEVDRMIVQLNEDFHTSIEDDFQPYLAAMILGNLDFLDDPKDAAAFYRGLVVQYARTNHIKKAQLIMEPERLRLYLRIANPLVHIVATNVGRNLYADRKRHTVVLLNNGTNVPFITADQPIINIASSLKATQVPPEKFELYYPLSPTRAMLLLEPSSDFLPGNSSISETLVHIYNLRMAAHSYRQVFSESQQVLESVRDERTAYMSCFK